MVRHYSWKVGQPLPVLGEHSLAKHRVFASYTARYIRILSPVLQMRKFKLTIVDGFCGGGLYSFDGGVVPGSPLLLLRSAKAAEIEAWLEKVADAYNVLPMDVRAFRCWARLMHRRSDQLMEDAMIAAIAIVNGLTVVTRNVRDFRQFGVNTLNPFEPTR